LGSSVSRLRAPGVAPSARITLRKASSRVSGGSSGISRTRVWRNLQPVLNDVAEAFQPESSALTPKKRPGPALPR